MKSEGLARQLVNLCSKRGADGAEALIINQQEKASNVFNQHAQLSTANNMTRIAARVFRNNKGAIILGRGYSERALEDIVDRAMASTQQNSPDKYLGCADPEMAGKVSDDLKIYDQRLNDLSPDQMQEIALKAESAIAKKDQRLAHLITSTFQVTTQDLTLCTSQGFCESYQTTTASLALSAVTNDYFSEMPSHGPQSEEGKLTGGATITTHTLDGLDFEKVAGRTVEQLSTMQGARPSPSGWFPVVFAPLAARRIASSLLQFSSGPVAMILGGTFLVKIGEQICSPLITIIDDPLRPGGLRTAPFDNEGVKPRRNVIIEKGVLREYLLNSYYARALQRDSTGNAAANEDVRYTTRPSNAYIEQGNASRDQIIADIKQGLYVTTFISPSQLTLAATNFTQAVAGIWIEQGKLTYPVKAATISAPFMETLKNISAVGSDIDYETAVSSPSLLVSKMNINPLM